MNRSNKHSHRQRWIRLFYSILVNRFPALHAPPMPTRLHAPVSYLVVHLAIVSSQLSFAVHHSVLLRIQHFPRRAILGTSSILQPYRSINRITHS